MRRLGLLLSLAVFLSSPLFAQISTGSIAGTVTDRGAGVLLVSIDRPEQRARAEEMLAQYRLLAVPAVLLDAPDPDPVLRAVGEPKWDGTLPATFVFDAEGKLRKSFIGRASPAKLEAAVRSLTP